MQIGSNPRNASPRLLEALEIIRSSDRSDAKMGRLKELADQSSGEEVYRIGDLIEAFIASKEF
jgi:hypothetical protein